jgi:hypothetical protein
VHGFVSFNFYPPAFRPIAFFSNLYTDYSIALVFYRYTFSVVVNFLRYKARTYCRSRYTIRLYNGIIFQHHCKCGVDKFTGDAYTVFVRLTTSNTNMHTIYSFLQMLAYWVVGSTAPIRRSIG